MKLGVLATPQLVEQHHQNRGEEARLNQTPKTTTPPCQEVRKVARQRRVLSRQRIRFVKKFVVISIRRELGILLSGFQDYWERKSSRGVSSMPSWCAKKRSAPDHYVLH